MTEDQLIEDLRTAYSMATDDLMPRVGIAQEVRRIHNQQSRRARTLLVVTPLVLAGAAFATIGLSGGPGHRTHPATSTRPPASGGAHRLTGPVVQLAGYTVRLPASIKVDTCSANSVIGQGPNGGDVKVNVVSGPFPTGPGSQQSLTVAGYPATLIDVPTDPGVIVPFFRLVVNVPTSTDPSQMFVVVADGIDQNTVVAIAEQAISSPNNGGTSC